MRKKSLVMTLVLSLALCFGSIQTAFAATWSELPTEDKVEKVTYQFMKEVNEGKYKTIDTDTLASQVQAGKKMIIVDTMPAASSYNKEHVPGAINAVVEMTTITDAQKKDLIAKVNAKLPTKTVTKTTLKKVTKSAYNKLKKTNRTTKKVNGKTVYYKKTVTKTKSVDKSYKIVVYCGHIGCARSHYGAQYLVKQGYTNVYRYGGGISAWTAAGNKSESADDTYNYVNADYVNGKLNNSNVVLLDVRKAVDFEKGHVPGAVNASTVSDAVPEEATAADGVAADNIKTVVNKYGKDKEYILLCYSGNRYAVAGTKLLRAEGVDYNKIKTLGGDDNKQSANGGMKAWAAKYPVVTDKTVSINCTVASTEAHEHWFIVNENGTMAKNTVLKTAITTDDFYDALSLVTKGKVWNDTTADFGADESINDQLDKGVGHDDFAHLDVTVAWGGKTYKLSDIITDASYKNEAYKGAYDVAFAGNLTNQHNAKTGCITCFGGCYMGITSGYDTPMMIKYTPENLPAVGQDVTVTYTVK